MSLVYFHRKRQPFILVLTFVSVDKISVLVLSVLNKIKFWQYKDEMTEFSSIVFKAGRRGKFILAYNKTVLFRVVGWSLHLKTFELWSKEHWVSSIYSRDDVIEGRFLNSLWTGSMFGEKIARKGKGAGGGAFPSPQFPARPKACSQASS